MHAPLQEVGDILIKSIRNRIQQYQCKRICACWWIAPFVSASLCVLCPCACLPVPVRKRMEDRMEELPQGEGDEDF